MHFFSEHQPFLSTPSARRATCAACASICRRGNFYPRPPRGGRPSSNTPNSRTSRFLSTPSARRATGLLIAPTRCLCNFYPRPPRGGRRTDKARHCQAGAISIHALREEGDTSGTMGGTITALFLSTPSARRATNAILEQSGDIQISIHALREEGDALSSRSYRSATKFLSTPSATRSLKF